MSAAPRLMITGEQVAVVNYCRGCSQSVIHSARFGLVLDSDRFRYTVLVMINSDIFKVSKAFSMSRSAYWIEGLVVSPVKVDTAIAAPSGMPS